MNDWYDKCLEQFLSDVATYLDVDKDTVKQVYDVFNYRGVIDYDIMKEFFHEVYTKDE